MLRRMRRRQQRFRPLSYIRGSHASTVDMHELASGIDFELVTPREVGGA